MIVIASCLYMAFYVGFVKNNNNKHRVVVLLYTLCAKPIKQSNKSLCTQEENSSRQFFFSQPNSN